MFDPHISLIRCARADCPLSSALRVDRMDVAEYLVSQGADLGESLMRLAGCTDKRLARMLGVRLGKYRMIKTFLRIKEVVSMNISKTQSILQLL